MSNDLVTRLRVRSDIASRLMREAAERIEMLESALHRISLGSQNSMTSKEDLGATARRALGQPNRIDVTECGPDYDIG